MSLVSVVLPTRDRLALVREAVTSVLAQSFADLELIVVDDGSADDTAALLRREHGERIVVLETSGRGVSAARNAGAAAARGSWLAFLDSDDLWEPHKLTAQMAHLARHPEASICHSEEIWIRGGVRVNPRRHHAKPEGNVFAASLERCVVSPSTVVLRRPLFEDAGGFDESLPVCEDYDLWLRLARTTRFELIPEPLVIRREGHGDQLSHRHWGMDRFRVTALRKLLDGPLSAEQRRATLEVLRRKCAILAAGAEKRGRGDEASAYRALSEAHV